MAEKILTPEEYYKKVAKEDKETILDLSNPTPIEFIPSGSWVMNKIIGDGTMTSKPGGYPRGHITEIFGDESSGKTTFALSAIRQAQEMGMLGILLDFEQTFHQAYATKLGVSLDKKKFMVTQPSTFEQGARQIRDMLLMKPGIIVVDSVSAMTPRDFLEGAVDEAGRIGLQAQLMSAFMGYITKFLKDSNSCLLFTNQLRSIIKKNPQMDHGPDEETSGGRAMRFYSSVRIKLKKSTVEKINVTSNITGKADKEPIHVTIRATVVKNKIDKPYYSAPIYIRFGEGVDNISSVLDLAINTNVIKRSGAFYSFSQDDKQVVKVAGKEKMWQRLKEDEKLFGILRDSLVIKEDTKVKEEYANVDDSLETINEIDDVLGSVSANFIEKKKKKQQDEEV